MQSVTFALFNANDSGDFNNAHGRQAVSLASTGSRK